MEDKKDNRITGKVKWFNEWKGYGFIEGSDSKDYFVHNGALLDKIKTNDTVMFEANKKIKGLCAEAVEKVVSE